MKNDGTIIDFRQNETVRDGYSAQALLHGYWEGLSEGNAVPFRSQLDPRAIESVLEYAFVLERIAPGVCRFRLAGRHLNDLMGQEVRGMPATALFEPESRNEIGKLLEQVCTRSALVKSTLQAPGGFGRTELPGQLFLAPLCDDRGQVTRVLGCLQSHGTIGRQPRRFSLVNAVQTATKFSDIAPALPTSYPKHAFSEQAGKFEHKHRTNPAGTPTDTSSPISPEPTEHYRTGIHLVVDNT